MDLYHKWDVKTDFAYVLQFCSLISDSLGSVTNTAIKNYLANKTCTTFLSGQKNNENWVLDPTQEFIREG